MSLRPFVHLLNTEPWDLIINTHFLPEGEISSLARAAGQPPKDGAALLALRSRAPVFPAYIAGGPQTPHLLRNWLWPSCGACVFFGPAIDLAPYYDQPIDRPLLRQVTRLFMERIAALRPSQPASLRAQRRQVVPWPATRAG
jgi:1-acyl-sn-glycerol-3-phosphate acyltransferase